MGACRTRSGCGSMRIPSRPPSGPRATRLSAPHEGLLPPFGPGPALGTVCRLGPPIWVARGIDGPCRLAVCGRKVGARGETQACGSGPARSGPLQARCSRRGLVCGAGPSRALGLACGCAAAWRAAARHASAVAWRGCVMRRGTKKVSERVLKLSILSEALKGFCVECLPGALVWLGHGNKHILAFGKEFVMVAKQHGG